MERGGRETEKVEELRAATQCGHMVPWERDDKKNFKEVSCVSYSVTPLLAAHQLWSTFLFKDVGFKTCLQVLWPISHQKVESTSLSLECGLSSSRRQRKWFCVTSVVRPQVFPLTANIHHQTCEWMNLQMVRAHAVIVSGAGPSLAQIADLWAKSVTVVLSHQVLGWFVM